MRGIENANISNEKKKLCEKGEKKTRQQNSVAKMRARKITNKYDTCHTPLCVRCCDL